MDNRLSKIAALAEQDPDIAIDWQQALGLRDFEFSVVDINQAPTPLAWEIIQADAR